jgi:hypothetical protein
MQLTAVAVAILATGCIGGGARNIGGAPTTGPSIRVVTSGPPVTVGAIVRPVKVGYGPYEVRYGLDRLWVATAAGVVSVNPASGNVVGRADLNNQSEWSNVALGDDKVWFLGGVGLSAMVVPVNPRTLKGEPPIYFHHTGNEAFENIGASIDGVCVGRLAPTALSGAVCAPQPRGAPSSFFLRAGPGPLLGTPDGTIWIGGRALVRVNPRTHNSQTVAVAKGGAVVALAADGPTTWAAVNYDHGSSELWQIVGARVDRRVSIRTRSVSSLTAEGGGLWIMSAQHHSNWIEAVLPSGALRRVARVPMDARTLAASPSALWTARFQSGVVLEISRQR